MGPLRGAPARAGTPPRSSGTKGKPTVVGYTRRDLEIWREVMARSLAAGGAEPGHLIQIAYGYGLFTGGSASTTAPSTWASRWCRCRRAIRCARCCSSRTSVPTGLACTPSFALHIGEALRESGWTRARRLARTGSSAPSPGRRRCAPSSRRCGAWCASDFYGLRSSIGPGVAAECAGPRRPARQRRPLPARDRRSRHWRPAGPPGKEGELVLTALTREALPMLRYRTGDLTSLNPEPCACGRTTARMARAEGAHRRHGRHQGRQCVSLPGGSGAVDDRGAGPALSARGGPDPGLPSLTVHVEPAEGLVGAWGGFDAARDRGRRPRRPGGERLRGHLGLNPEIAIVPPETIPRSEGKAVRVVERS